MDCQECALQLLAEMINDIARREASLPKSAIEAQTLASRVGQGLAPHKVYR